MSAWLCAFLFGQALEVPVYVVALRRTRFSLAMRVLLAFVASALTHPFVWFLFPRLFPDPDSYFTMAVAAETFAVLAEGVYLWHCGLDPEAALPWSLGANALSCGLGLLSRSLFGWP